MAHSVQSRGERPVQDSCLSLKTKNNLSDFLGVAGIVTGLALFAITCATLAKTYPSSLFNVTLLGLSGGSFALISASILIQPNRPKQAKVTFISLLAIFQTAIYFTLGGLGMGNVLTTQRVAFATFTTALGGYALLMTGIALYASNLSKKNQQPPVQTAPKTSYHLETNDTAQF